MISSQQRSRSHSHCHAYGEVNQIVTPLKSLFPDALRKFIDTSQWTFAKTMPEWPHEYLVRDRVDKVLFEALVCHIRQYGFEGRFYQRVFTYFAEDGLLYWTMGKPIEETTIVN